MGRPEISRLLLEKGYAPLRLQERVVSMAARRALAVLGEHSVVALLYHMSTITGLKEKELLSNLVEFEKALWSSLGYGADILLKRFNEELARTVGRTNIGLGEMFDQIRNNERVVFARSVAQGENMALLYNTKDFRDKIISAFFEPTEGGDIMAALLERSSHLPASVARTTYGELRADRSPAALGNKFAEWMSVVRPAGSPLRLAKDNTWLVENGMPEPSHDTIGVRGTAFLCAYDLSKIDSASAARAAELHDFVMVEGLQQIYVRG